MALGLPDLLAISFFIALSGIVVILPFWFIFTKAGFSGWLSLTQIIPIVNIVALFYLAFAEWPIHRDVPRPGTWQPGA